MMKLEQDTATKEDIWLETNDFGDRCEHKTDSETQRMEDTQMRTGGRAGHHH